MAKERECEDVTAKRENAMAKVQRCDNSIASSPSQLLTFAFASSRFAVASSHFRLRNFAPRPKDESAKVEVVPSEHHNPPIEMDDILGRQLYNKNAGHVWDRRSYEIYIFLKL